MIQRVEAGRELGQAALGELGKALPELMNQGVTEVALDTSRVAEFDSGTLEAILEFEALAQSRGLAVTVFNPSTLLSTALAITGVMDRVPVTTAEGVRLTSAAYISQSFAEDSTGDES